MLDQIHGVDAVDLEVIVEPGVGHHARRLDLEQLDETVAHGGGDLIAGHHERRSRSAMAESNSFASCAFNSREPRGKGAARNGARSMAVPTRRLNCARRAGMRYQGSCFDKVGG